MTTQEIYTNEARFNELMEKHRRAGLTSTEDRERRAIIRWQVNNRLFASMIKGQTTFIPLDSLT